MDGAAVNAMSAESEAESETKAVPDRTEEQLLRLFFGRNAERFLIYLHAERDKSNLFWTRMNFITFLAPVAWYFYRRMYLYGALIFLLPIVLTLLIPKLPHSALTGFGAALAVMSNQIYFHYARNKVARIEKRSDLPAEARDALIQRSGGTSILGAILGSVLTIAIMLLVIANASKG